MKANTPLIIDQFDGFSVIRADILPFLDDQLTNYMNEARRLVSGGSKLIFIDFGKTPNMSASMLQTLIRETANFKSQQVEVVFLAEAGLTTQLRSSPLAKSAAFFERLDNHAQKVAAAKVLDKGRDQLGERLSASLGSAIEVGLHRWIGQKPKSITSANVNLNPLTDVVSVVEMIVDGCAFQIFLGGPREVLREMVQKILNAKVDSEDKLVADAARELLNYLTAFFKQQLTTLDGAVETEAPRLLEPDEVMMFLDLELRSQRVETAFGTFDIWMDVAA